MRQLPALLCLIALAHPAPALAQSEIHRCIGSNGGAVFTDQPCSALHATAVTTPPSGGEQPAETGPPPDLCAATFTALRQAVIAAFARHDANRLAGLMLWNGYGRGAAVADIGSLATLMRQPLLDITPGDDPASTDSADPAASSSDPFAPDPLPTAAAAGGELVLHVGGNDGSGSPHQLRFGIVQRSGCLWLRNAP